MKGDHCWFVNDNPVDPQFVELHTHQYGYIKVSTLRVVEQHGRYVECEWDEHLLDGIRRHRGLFEVGVLRWTGSHTETIGEIVRTDDSM